MKNKLILLVDEDADCGGLVLEAAARTAHGVRLSRGSKEAFRVLSHDFDRINTIIIDVDPGGRGMALLEAVSALHRRPPFIVLTSLEESHMQPVVARHGAIDCLGKPLSIDRLCAALDRVSGREPDRLSSDPWGHPREVEEEVENGAHA